MEKDFIPQDRALRLKNLGFDEPCLRGWDIDGVVWYHPDSEVVLDNPTFSQAFRWFREKYMLIPTIRPFSKGKTFFFSIIGEIEDFTSGSKEFKYEEAELACLDKLLEIAESI